MSENTMTIETGGHSVTLREGDMERAAERIAEIITGATPTTYLFEECDFTGAGYKIRGSGSDRYVMEFQGQGPRCFLASFADGEPAGKPVAGPWKIDVLRFAENGVAVGPDGLPAGEFDPTTYQLLDIHDKALDAKVTVVNVLDLGGDARPVCKVVVEMAVRRGGGGMIRELTGDPIEDAEILDEDLYLAAGNMGGLRGTLYLLRPAGAQQGELPLATGPGAAPEGAKEKTIRRGTRKAVNALANAISATDRSGATVDLAKARAEFEADQELHLRTWEGAGVVKVLRGFDLLYVLRMPDAAPEVAAAEPQGIPSDATCATCGTFTPDDGENGTCTCGGGAADTKPTGKACVCWTDPKAEPTVEA